MLNSLINASFVLHSFFSEQTVVFVHYYNVHVKKFKSCVNIQLMCENSFKTTSPIVEVKNGALGLLDPQVFTLWESVYWKVIFITFLMFHNQ